MPIVTTPGQPVSRIQATTGASSVSSSDPDIDNSQPVVPAMDPPAQAPAYTKPQIPSFIDDDEDTTPSTGFDDTDDDDDSYEPSPTPGKSTGVSLSRMSEEDRRKVITTIFQSVLGRDPSDRDFSYYRFSTLTEDGLMKSLLSLPEHKQMVEKAREHTALKQSVNELDLRVKQLDTSVQSMKQELQTLEYLLAEKNRYIQQMRGVPSDRQVQMPAPPQPVIPQQAAQPTPQQPKAPEQPDVVVTNLPTPVDEVKSMFKGLFGGKK